VACVPVLNAGIRDQRLMRMSTTRVDVIAEQGVEVGSVVQAGVANRVQGTRGHG
jgi:hypothetical protein